MWSEDLDKKIKLAAERDNPAFDEKAWDKMLPLLDKHLPQEKKRRRILFLFFMFLLTGITVFFILQRTAQRGRNTVRQTQAPSSATNNSTTTTNSRPAIPVSIIAGTEKNTLEKIIPVPTAGNTVFNKFPEPLLLPAKFNTKQNRVIVNKKAGRVKNQPTIAYQPLPKDVAFNSGDDVSGNQSSVNEPISSRSTIPAKTTGPALLPSIISQTDSFVKIIASKNDKESIDTATTIPVTEKKKKPGSKTSKWGLSISAGPDISGVSINKTGKPKLQFGMGLSYELNRKWTLRTGFYASRKIYTADSADYHPPYGFSTYYPNLQKIDANCVVYEIPVSIVYNFSSASKHNWFASAGLSSYLMKKEDYTYTYKNSWGQVQYRNSSFRNENTHLFSILHISGGYQYSITDRFSISAEPYMKLPVAGVGFGKVKLNSGGLLFTATLKPFAGKK